MMPDKINVLLVEDTLVAQIIARKHIESQGGEVDLAQDGQSALQKAMSNQYDLILMDIGLGDGPDGFEVARQISSQPGINCNTTIVALTAHVGEDEINKAEKAGMELYYTKPLKPENVSEIIAYIKNKLG